MSTVWANDRSERQNAAKVGLDAEIVSPEEKYMGADRPRERQSIAEPQRA